MTNKFIKTICVVLITATVFAASFNVEKIPKAQAFDFNPNNLIDDSKFIDTNSMSAGDIQIFLNSQGGFLKDFSENGRSAAQIIYDAAHGHGDASGSPPNGCDDGICINGSTGTISPKVILVTLQKEQSLLTDTNYSSYALDWAMGYGCPDEGNHYEQYRGFTKQVEWASWQLRYNYERAAGRGFSYYQVNDIIHFYNTYPNPYGGPPEQDVHIDNRATSSLYRYTPHVYNGNYNFSRLYNTYFDSPARVQQKFQGELISQTVNPTNPLAPDGTYQVEVKFLNTGINQWIKGEVNLGTTDPSDRISQFNGGSGWTAIGNGTDVNRVKMNEDSVLPWQTATFTFTFKASSTMPTLSHNAQENFKLVKDVGGDLGWFSDETKVNFIIPVKGIDSTYQYQYISQNNYSALTPGTPYEMQLVVKNTGESTWTRDTVRLGTSQPIDRTPFYTTGAGWVGSNNNRIQMQEAVVEPGGFASFNFTITVPENNLGGTYREYFRLVADNISWMQDYGIYWDIKVPAIAERYNYQYISQSTYPTILPGHSETLQLTLKNTGTNTWDQNTVRLGTDKPLDRIPFYNLGDSWIVANNNRIQMQETSVSPGDEAHFIFTITIPENNLGGNYREYFRLVADGLVWMQDYGIYWDIKVPTPQERFDCEWQSQTRADNPDSEPITLYPGQTLNNLSVTFENTGLESWPRDTIHLGTSHNMDRISSFLGYPGQYGWISPNRIQMEQQTTIVPGQTATFTFDLKVPDNMASGEYKEYFQMVADGLAWMQDFGVYWRIRVP